MLPPTNTFLFLPDAEEALADMEQKAKELEVERKIQEAAGDKQAKETLKEQRRNEARIASVAAENKVREEELDLLEIQSAAHRRTKAVLPVIVQVFDENIKSAVREIEERREVRVRERKGRKFS